MLCFYREIFLQINSFKNMLNKKQIIAIFKENYFIEELITLFKDEGLEIIKINSLLKMNEIISGKILLVDIESKKKLETFKKFMKQTVRDCDVFVTYAKNLETDIKDVNLLKPPIHFRELINQIYKILEKKRNLSYIVKLKNLQFNFRNYELTNNQSTKKIRLTELEGRLLKFLSENIKGSTKQELLSKVWRHNKVLDTHTLESLIYRLRKKIEINPNEPEILILKEKKYFLKKN